ncbi:MAG: hypothetical protein ACKOCQ_04925 [Candidatus Nitrosotenuis sp.]
MDDNARNSQIMDVAELLVRDNVSLNEQDQAKLQKYCDFAQKKFSLSSDDSVDLVNETLLYLTLKNAKDVDPLQDGDKFGAGFS